MPTATGWPPMSLVLCFPGGSPPPSQHRSSLPQTCPAPCAHPTTRSSYTLCPADIHWQFGSPRLPGTLIRLLLNPPSQPASSQNFPACCPLHGCPSPRETPPAPAVACSMRFSNLPCYRGRLPDFPVPPLHTPYPPLCGRSPGSVRNTCALAEDLLGRNSRSQDYLTLTTRAAPLPTCEILAARRQTSSLHPQSRRGHKARCRWNSARLPHLPDRQLR